MGKVLPILGIVGAVVAMAAAMVLQNAAQYLTPLWVLAVAVVAFFQRRKAGYIAGAVLALLGLLSLVTVAGGIELKGASDLGGGSDATGRLIALAAALAVPVAVVAIRCDSTEPKWLTYVTWAAAGLSLAAASMGRDGLDDQQNTLTLVAGFAALATVAGPIGALRGHEEDAPPLPPPPAGAARGPPKTR